MNKSKITLEQIKPKMPYYYSRLEGKNIFVRTKEYKIALAEWYELVRVVKLFYKQTKSTPNQRPITKLRKR